MVPRAKVGGTIARDERHKGDASRDVLADVATGHSSGLRSRFAMARSLARQRKAQIRRVAPQVRGVVFSGSDTFLRTWLLVAMCLVDGPPSSTFSRTWLRLRAGAPGPKGRSCERRYFRRLLSRSHWMLPNLAGLRFPIQDPPAIQTGRHFFRATHGMDDVSLRLDVAALANLV
jgi:hypothetical protein